MVIEGLPWTRKIVDDILVWAETEEELMERTRVILNRCKEHNITISRKKLELGTELGFAGHIVSQNGISPDDDKYKAIKEFPAPKNLKDLIIPRSGKSISSICTRSSSHVCRPQAVAKERKCMGVGKRT